MKIKDYILSIIIILIIYCLVISIYLVCISNIKYIEQEKVQINNDLILIKNTYLVDSTYSNQKIDKNNKFLIISINTTLDFNELYLKIDNNIYNNNCDLQKYFKDIDLNPLIFTISNTDVNKKMELYYQYKDKWINRNITFTLNPQSYDTNDIIETKLNNDLDIKIIDEKINIKSYEISNRINTKYIYNNTTINKIFSSHDKLILTFELKDYIESLDKLFKIKYSINNIEYESININQYDKNYLNSYYIKVDKEIESADEIWLEFKIRNNIYKYILK